MLAWPSEHRQHAALCFDRIADDEIQLGAVAGRDRDGFVDVGVAAQVA